jgi:hypothetical protein
MPLAEWVRTEEARWSPPPLSPWPSSFEMTLLFSARWSGADSMTLRISLKSLRDLLKNQVLLQSLGLDEGYEGI